MTEDIINRMDKLKDHIKEKRPTLSPSSITTYTSILRSLHNKIFGKGSDFDFKDYDETDKILEYLKDVPANKRKTILSALVVITDKKPYRDLMLDDVRSYNEEIHKQEKTPTQEASWVQSDEIEQIFNDLKREAGFIYKKKTFHPQELQQLQNFIIITLLGGIKELGLAPRRSMDYCKFKIRNVDKTKDNYLDKNQMVFNSYKTAKTYGQQVVPISPAVKKILNAWIKVNPTEWLLFDNNMNPLTSVKLNQRLNRIFNEKKVGVNALRHSYLTNEFGHTIALEKKIDNTMEQMGSSRNMLETYVKK